VERYGPRSEDSRSPVGEAERLAFAEEIGQQGRELLDALFDPTAPEWFRLIPAVETLRQVWVQNYQRVDDIVRWRSSENIPPVLNGTSSFTPDDAFTRSSRNAFPSEKLSPQGSAIIGK
jgi:hypothetical protein